MGGVLYPQPPRKVTLKYRDLPEPTFLEHIQNLFTPPAPPSPAGGVHGGEPPAQCGVGVGIRVDGGYTTITDLVRGGPAERSRSIRPGDTLVAVDGQVKRLYNPLCVAEIKTWA